MENHLVCIFCKIARFSNPDDLLDHLRIHTGDIPEIDLVSNDSEENRSIDDALDQQVSSIENDSEKTESVGTYWEDGCLNESPISQVTKNTVSGPSSEEKRGPGCNDNIPYIDQVSYGKHDYEVSGVNTTYPVESWTSASAQGPDYRSGFNQSVSDTNIDTSNTAVRKITDLPGFSNPPAPHTAPVTLQGAKRQLLHQFDESRTDVSTPPQKMPKILSVHGAVNASGENATGKYLDGSDDKNGHRSVDAIASVVQQAQHSQLGASSSAQYLDYHLGSLAEAQLLLGLQSGTENHYPPDFTATPGAPALPIPNGDMPSKTSLAKIMSVVDQTESPADSRSTGQFTILPQIDGIPASAQHPPPVGQSYDVPLPTGDAYIGPGDKGYSVIAPYVVQQLYGESIPELPSVVTNSVSTSTLGSSLSYSTSTTLSPSIDITCVPPVVTILPAKYATDLPTTSAKGLSPSTGTSITSPVDANMVPPQSAVVTTLSPKFTTGVAPSAIGTSLAPIDVNSLSPSDVNSLSPSAVVTKTVSPGEVVGRVSSVVHGLQTSKSVLPASPLRGKVTITSPPPKHLMLSPNRKATSAPPSKTMTTLIQSNVSFLPCIPPTDKKMARCKTVSTSAPKVNTAATLPLIKRAYTSRGKPTEDTCTKHIKPTISDTGFSSNQLEGRKQASKTATPQQESQTLATTLPLIKRAPTYMPFPVSRGNPIEDKSIEQYLEATSTKTVISLSEDQFTRKRQSRELGTSQQENQHIPSTMPQIGRAYSLPFSISRGKPSGDKSSELHLSQTSLEAAHSWIQYAGGKQAEELVESQRENHPLNEINMEQPPEGSHRFQNESGEKYDYGEPVSISSKNQSTSKTRENNICVPAQEESSQHDVGGDKSSVSPSTASLHTEPTAAVYAEKVFTTADSTTGEIAAVNQIEACSSFENHLKASGGDGEDSSSSEDECTIIAGNKPESQLRESYSSSSDDDVIILPTASKLTEAVTSNLASQSGRHKGKLMKVKLEPMSVSKDIAYQDGNGDLEKGEASCKLQELGFRTLVKDDVNEGCIDVKLRIELVKNRSQMNEAASYGDVRKQDFPKLEAAHSEATRSNVKQIRFHCPKCQSGFHRIVDQMKHRCKGRPDEKSFNISTAFARLKMFKCLNCLREFATLGEKNQHICGEIIPELDRSENGGQDLKNETLTPAEQKRKRGRPKYADLANATTKDVFNYKCLRCGKRYVKEHWLRGHMEYCMKNRAHSNSDTIPVDEAPEQATNLLHEKLDATDLSRKPEQDQVQESRRTVDGNLTKTVKSGEQIGSKFSNASTAMKHEEICNKSKVPEGGGDNNQGNMPMKQPHLELQQTHDELSTKPTAEVAYQMDSDKDQYALVDNKGIQITESDAENTSGSHCPFCKDGSRTFQSARSLSMHTMYAHNKIVCAKRSGWYFGDAASVTAETQDGIDGRDATSEGGESASPDLWKCSLCKFTKYAFITKESYVAHHKAKHGMTAVGESLITNRRMSASAGSKFNEGLADSSVKVPEIMDMTEAASAVCEENQITTEPDEISKTCKENESAPQKCVDPKMLHVCKQSKSKSTTELFGGEAQELAKSLSNQNKKICLGESSKQSCPVIETVESSSRATLQSENDDSPSMAGSSAEVCEEPERPETVSLDMIHSLETDLYQCCHCNFKSSLYSAAQRHQITAHNIRRPNVANPGSSAGQITSQSDQDNSSSAGFQYDKYISALKTITPTFKRTANGFLCSICKADVPKGGRKYHAQRNHHVVYKCGLCNQKIVGKSMVIKHIDATHGDVDSAEEAKMGAFARNSKHARCKRADGSTGESYGSKSLPDGMKSRSCTSDVSRSTGSGKKCSLVEGEDFVKVVPDFDMNELSKYKEVNGGKFECPHCKKIVSRGSRKPHMMFHSNIKPYRCKHCDFATALRTSVDQHVLLKHKMNFAWIKTCYFIDAKVNKRSQVLAKEQSKDPNSRLYICSFCKIMISKPNLPTHMLLHTGENPYKCKLCAYTSKQWGPMAFHVHQYHPEGSDDRPVAVSTSATESKAGSKKKKRVRENASSEINARRDQGSLKVVDSVENGIGLVTMKSAAKEKEKDAEKKHSDGTGFRYTRRGEVTVALIDGTGKGIEAAKQSGVGEITSQECLESPDVMEKNMEEVENDLTAGRLVEVSLKECGGPRSERRSDVVGKKGAEKQGSHLTTERSKDMLEEYGDTVRRLEAGKAQPESLKLVSQDMVKDSNLGQCEDDEDLQGTRQKAETIKETQATPLKSAANEEFDKIASSKKRKVKCQQWIRACYLYDSVIMEESNKLAKEQPFDSVSGVYTCSFCKEKVKKLYMAVHILKHTEKNPYQCMLCDYSCKQWGSINIHVQRRHPEGMVAESEKKRNPLKRAAVTAKETITGKKMCSVETGMKQGTILEKMDVVETGTEPTGIRRSLRTKKRDSIDAQDGEGNATVQASGLSARKPASLKRAPKRPASSHTKALYSCDEMVLMENMDIALKQPFDINARLYTCSYCGGRFGRQSMLIHILQHTGAYPFQCKVCPYQCKQMVAIEGHVRKKHMSNSGELSSDTIRERAEKGGGDGNIVEAVQEQRLPFKKRRLEDTKYPATQMLKIANEDVVKYNVDQIETVNLGEKTIASNEYAVTGRVERVGHGYISGEACDRNYKSGEREESFRKDDGVEETMETSEEQSLNLGMLFEAECTRVRQGDGGKRKVTDGQMHDVTMLAEVKHKKFGQSTLAGKLKMRAELQTDVENVFKKQKLQSQVEFTREEAVNFSKEQEDVRSKIIEQQKSFPRETISHSQAEPVSKKCQGNSGKIERTAAAVVNNMQGRCNTRGSRQKDSVDEGKDSAVEAEKLLVVTDDEEQHASTMSKKQTELNAGDFLMQVQQYIQKTGEQVLFELENQPKRNYNDSQTSASVSLEAKEAVRSPLQKPKKEQKPSLGIVIEEQEQSDGSDVDSNIKFMYTTYPFQTLPEMMYYLSSLTGHYRCQECDTEFQSHKKAEEHCKTHNDLRMHACKYCSYSSRHLMCIRGHVELCHKDELTSGADCLKKSSTTLTRIPKIPSKLVENCFVMIRTQRDKKMRPGRFVNNGNYQCHFCTFESASYFKAEEHTRTHTREKVYHCLVCVEKGSNRDDMVSHVLCHRQPINVPLRPQKGHNDASSNLLQEVIGHETSDNDSEHYNNESAQKSCTNKRRHLRTNKDKQKNDGVDSSSVSNKDGDDDAVKSKQEERSVWKCLSRSDYFHI